MRFARYFSVKTSRILLHPTGLTRRTLYPPSPTIRNSLSIRTQSAHKTLSRHQPQAKSLGVGSRSAASTFSLGLGPRVDGRRRHNVLTSSRCLYTPSSFRDDNAVFVDVFCPLSFSPALSPHEMRRGNIKLISEDNAVQTERSLPFAFGYLIIPSLPFFRPVPCSISKALLLVLNSFGVMQSWTWLCSYP